MSNTQKIIDTSKRKELKIGVVGSRRRNSEADLKILAEFLSKILTFYSDEYKIILVSGGCKKGGDYFAEVLTRAWKLSPMIIHYPDKSKLPSDPQRYDFAKINFDRNTLIARDSAQPDQLPTEDYRSHWQCLQDKLRWD